MTLNDSRYFSLIELGTGIYGAVIKPGSGALGNAGFIDLGQELLVFDTFLIPEAARDLRSIAEEMTGKKVKYVIISHWHGDHIYGNQVFDDCILISTKKTRDLMKEKCSITDLDQTVKSYHEYLNTQEQRIQTETNELMRIALINDYNDKKIFAESLPEIKLVLPTVTFVDSLCIHGSERSVEIHSYGGGHTDCDAFLWIPDEKVVFSGDLILADTHPYIGTGHTRDWLKILEKIGKKEVNKILPGHGNVGNRSNITDMVAYLQYIISFSKDCKGKGLALEDTLKLPIKKEFENWNDPHVYEWNLAYLFSNE